MSGSDLQNEHLIADLIAGRNTDESFRVLFGRYHPRVLGFFRHKGVSEDDARELTQDVFVSVFRGVSHIRSAARC